MPGDFNSKHELSEKAATHSLSQAKNIRNPETGGTSFDIRVLSETTGTKVVTLEQDSYGKFTKMQEFNPSTRAASQTVTLIYRPESAQYPDGHYDVLINNQTVNIVNKGKSCLFHALARGMRPGASEEEITSAADDLRNVEADALLRHPGQWEPFIKRKEWTEAIRGGDWFMMKGASRNFTEEEITKTIEELNGSIYKDWRKCMIQNKGIGQIIHGDHQPPGYSIWRAGELNQNSKLATAWLELATKSSPLDYSLIEKAKRNHGCELPVFLVLADKHRKSISTTSKDFRVLVAETISKDDVLSTLKLAVLGAMPRCMLDNNQSNNNLQSGEMNRISDSFPKDCKKMVDTWFNRLESKPGLMTLEMKRGMYEWINQKKYEDQNDHLVKKLKTRCQ
ncbi:hypothetical protein AAFF_G00378400 [Aldrovandia affinis]|uniref:Uncharacterized protein n=1 Tax=Aldrovandia affinis TaxID=143900 RepID=A0AAD7R4F5_9TELE|nr:hypothetical protein AAFF_G00378400 [Aldrovandia affinis]